MTFFSIIQKDVTTRVKKNTRLGASPAINRRVRLGPGLKRLTSLVRNFMPCHCSPGIGQAWIMPKFLHRNPKVNANRFNSVLIL